MPPLAMALLLASALIHVGWNVLLKRSEGRMLVTWWALVGGALAALPVVLWVGIDLLTIWPLLLASALFETVYFLVLNAAYERADFSLIYPLARGTAPALIALWAALFLGERPGGGGLLGLALIVGGLLIIGGSGALAAGGAPLAAWGNALTAALMISCYSAIDGAAVKQVDPAPYSGLVFIFTALMLTPVMLRRHGWAALAGHARSNSGRILAMGALLLASYGLVLSAYAIAPVGYVGAVREISVVVGALVGWRWLGEQFGPARVLGASLIFAGVMAITLLGGGPSTNGSRIREGAKGHEYAEARRGTNIRTPCGSSYLL